MRQITKDTLQDEAQYLRLLVYGEPGVGKTWFAASAALSPETAPCLFLDFRGQVASLEHPRYKEVLAKKQLVILRLDHYKELNHVYSYLKSHGELGADSFGKLLPEFPRTVALDSLTELQRAEAMRRAGNRADTFLVDVEGPQIQDWGKLLNQFTLLAHLFYSLPMHVVFTALESVELSSTTGTEVPRVQSRRIALQGQAKRQLPAYALTVMRLVLSQTAGTHTIGYTAQDGVSVVKDQTGALPPKLGDPTLPGLVALLRGGEATQ